LAPESACCSFFSCSVTTVGDAQVALDIEVRPAYAHVLAGLLQRAAATLEAAA